MCPLGRRYFLKKVVPSFEKRKARQLTDLAKSLKILIKGVQFSEVAGLQPATLLKIDSFIDMKRRFQRRIHKNLTHSFDFFDKCKQLLKFK